MMQEKQNHKETTVLNVPETGKTEVIHRYGQATAVFDPEPINISGSIEAPAEYYTKRLAQNQVDPNTCHVVINKEDRRITLKTAPASPLCHTISGELKMFPPLKSMAINNYGKTKFSEPDFIILLKETRSLFMVQINCLSLIDEIQNLEARVDQKIHRGDDERANRKEIFEQTAETSLPKTFTLDCPIFIEEKEKQQKKSFEVELKYIYSGNAFQFWLESADLADIINQRADEVIDEQIKRFGKDIPIIYV